MNRTADTQTPLKPSLSDTLRPEVTEELLQDLTRRIVEAFHPYKVILFGSYAYGTPHRDSDVDLFVIMDSEETMHDRIVKVYEVAEVPFLPMDVLVRTPSEVEARVAMGDFFVIEILEKGKVLYDRGAAR
ncbi:MAG TPA: nucleotidyltransferase domain-containing protein [Chthonomonadaceae bacterium]|nr:nucleotidyltransferase domain-containing protein [Chthonomonadaceae bacterium]